MQIPFRFITSLISTCPLVVAFRLTGRDKPYSPISTTTLVFQGCIFLCKGDLEGEKSAFPHVKLQRCQVPVAENVLAKVPKKAKEGGWISLRTKNIIGRLTRGFERGKEPMEIVAYADVCSRLLASICSK